MKNINGSMPAHPSAISNGDGCVEDSNSNGYGYGLTKREHFASLAPKMPEWFALSFKVVVSDIDPITHTDDELRFASEYQSENYGLDESEFKIGSRVLSELNSYMDQVENERNVKSFFAWRTYYADQLLKELANELR
jgi:hypothetical protein